MNDTKHYTVVCPTVLTLPSRVDFFKIGFGSFSSALPISYVQDAEDLNSSSYLDFKIDKWRIDLRWRQEQKTEPMIRLEFLRGKQFAEFLEGIPDVEAAPDLWPPDTWAITMELDGDDIHTLDYVSLACLVCGVIDLGATKVIGDKVKEVPITFLSEEAKKLRNRLAGLTFK